MAADLDAADLALGASVCVDGVCLTVTHAERGTFTVDAAFETLERTTLGSLERGAVVNLEPSLRLGDPLGGHLVSGHVDGVGVVRSKVRHGDAYEVWIDAPRELSRFMPVKGSIAVDGVSLTINAVDGEGFSVGLIPHTLEVTTLGRLVSGQRVNLEVDMVARYVARLAEVEGQKTPEALRVALQEAGFMGSGETT